MISEISILGPIAWGLLAVLPLGLVCAALLSSHWIRGGEKQSDVAAVDHDKPHSSPEEDSKVLGISLPLDEDVAKPSVLDNSVLDLDEQTGRTIEKRTGFEDDRGIGADEVTGEKEKLGKEGERLLVDFVSTRENARALKLDESAISDARKQISMFEQEGKRDDCLALLYLQVGEYLCLNGKRNEGLELIRKCIELATSSKNNLLLAQLRLSLGALAVQEKDFTGACEQWQLARALFSDAGLKEHGEEVRAHMYKCGCPTEWVLSDF